MNRNAFIFHTVLVILTLQATIHAEIETDTLEQTVAIEGREPDFVSSQLSRDLNLPTPDYQRLPLEREKKLVRDEISKVEGRIENIQSKPLVTRAEAATVSPLKNKLMRMEGRMSQLTGR